MNILTKKKNFVYRGCKAIRKKENRGSVCEMDDEKNSSTPNATFICSCVRVRVRACAFRLWTCENAYFCHFLAKLTMLVFITLLENCENYVRKNENGSNACAWKGIAGNGVGAWVRRLSRRCQKRGKRGWKQKKWTNCTLFLQKERLYLNFANGFRE